jgi:hypothetical protein
LIEERYHRTFTAVPGCCHAKFYARSITCKKLDLN